MTPRRAVPDGPVVEQSGHPAELWPLAEAKLAAPRQRAGLVDRPRILRALDAGAETALTLVAAPPGFGKSTAVRAWCANRTTAHAWVTVDARDNDPVRLWTYVTAAVDRIRPGLGRATLTRLRAASDVASPIDELLNAIAGLGAELVSSLTTCKPSPMARRWHRSTMPSSISRRTHADRDQRIDPALKLARLRAGGPHSELRSDELALTLAEARELLVERGRIPLGDDEVKLLHERTEGWPAALVLATVWLGRVPDPVAAAQSGADHGFVADYLVSEVLGLLEEDVRSFLLRVAVLGRFTPQLCDGLFERSDSASLLAELERSNQLIVRLEPGGWHRVHSLLAELAELKLAAEEPGAATDIHRRAALWLRSRGLPGEAAEHAMMAGDHELVAELLVEQHLVLIRNGGARTLLRWVQALPAELVVANPQLAVGAATAATMIGHAVERRRLLHLASRSEVEHPERCTPYVRAVAGMVRAAAVDTDVGHAVREGRRAVAIAEVEAETLWWRGWVAPLARSISRVSPIRHGPRRCERSSIRTPPAARPAMRSPGRRSRWSRPSAGRSKWRGSTQPQRGRWWARSATAAAGSGATRPRAWDWCTRVRAASPRRSASSRPRSTSSVTRWRPFITRGSSSFWPVFAVVVAVSVTPTRHSGRPARRCASLRMVGGFRRLRTR